MFPVVLEVLFLIQVSWGRCNQKRCFPCNPDKDFYRGSPISLHVILSVLFKKTDTGKNSFVEDAGTQTQGQKDSQNSIWEGTDSVSNKGETGKEKMQEEKSKGFKSGHSFC